MDYVVSHMGNIHDSYTFQSTQIFKEHDTFLGLGEWMWADLAYPPLTWTIAPFKKPVHGQLTHEQRKLNYYVSKV